MRRISRLKNRGSHLRERRGMVNTKVVGEPLEGGDDVIQWEFRQRHSQGGGSAGLAGDGGRSAHRWPTWLVLGGFALAEPAWGARSTAFRGQWSFGNLIGSLVIMGILAALALFFIWPRRGG